jgi:hypothetical protein
LDTADGNFKDEACSSIKTMICEIEDHSKLKKSKDKERDRERER